LNNLRIFRAKARVELLILVNENPGKHVSSLNSHTPINKVWNAIRKIKGKGSGKKKISTSKGRE
jgi:hypothetical protein